MTGRPWETGGTDEFLYRLRYAWNGIRTDLNWRTVRALGLRYLLRSIYYELSFPFSYKVGCFGKCGRRVYWDPIVGAYCEECWF